MKQGFTLLELAIVLVVIGLIVGGITVGSNLIRSAELNSVISDFQKYKNAVETFQFKYQSLPGDMPDATDYWGVAHATPATCATTSSTGTETCDGDGNGLIQALPISHEQFRAWQHLANAGIIEGVFTGTDGPAGTTFHAVASENVPAGELTGSAFNIGMYVVPSGGDVNFYDGNYSKVFVFGADNTCCESRSAILVPEEAFMIDSKVDDGSPAFGNWKTYKSSFLPNCTTSDVATSAEYNLGQSSELCSFIIEFE